VRRVYPKGSGWIWDWETSRVLCGQVFEYGLVGCTLADRDGERWHRDGRALANGKSPGPDSGRPAGARADSVNPIFRQTFILQDLYT
jgi:hypothetical protein